MYTAVFESENQRAYATACTWVVGSGGVIPEEWIPILLSRSHVDIAIRVSVVPHCPIRACLIASSCSGPDPQYSVESVVRRFSSSKTIELSILNDETSFNRICYDVPSAHLHVDFSGYQHDGESLAYPFSIEPFLQNLMQNEGGVYQVHLMRQEPDVETRREALKYISRMKINPLFPDTITSIQIELVRRLLTPGEMVFECFAFYDEQVRDRWVRRMQEFFLKTANGLGFNEAPLSQADCSEALHSGLHPWRLFGPPKNLIQRAVHARDDLSLVTMMATLRTLCSKTATTQRRELVNSPILFLSYCSSDYAFASNLCHQLEESGVQCWIAPRNINSTLNYAEAIPLAVSCVKAMLVILSAATSDSDHIPREVDLALECKIPIITVRYENVLPRKALNYMLRTCQRIDAFQMNIPDVVAEIQQRIKETLSQKHTLKNAP